MIDVHVPKMGMSTVEVDVIGILVEVGQTVSAEDPVVEIEAEKAQFEVPAGVAGVIAEILVEVDDTVEVGDVLLRIDTGSEA